MAANLFENVNLVSIYDIKIEPKFEIRDQIDSIYSRIILIVKKLKIYSRIMGKFEITTKINKNQIDSIYSRIISIVEKLKIYSRIRL